MYRPATLQDVVDIKDTLREQDVREMYLWNGSTPEKGLGYSYLNSDMVWAMCSEDNVIGMIGVTPHNLYPTIGVPWMLCTPGVEYRRNTINLLKECKSYIDKMYDLYPTLTNFVHKDNTLSLRWLKWCGFKLISTETDFIQFIGHKI